MSLLTCRNVAMSYDGNIVLKNLNFTINQGDYLCIVGENGSGKTTLMKGMLGLLPVSYGAFQFSEGLVQKEIGYLPQQTGIQRDFPASVYEVVLSGCLNRRGARPFYTKKEKQIALQKHGTAVGVGFEKKMLQRAFRRAAAACFACKGVMRHKEAFDFGRTCDRAGSNCDKRAV